MIWRRFKTPVVGKTAGFAREAGLRLWSLFLKPTRRLYDPRPGRLWGLSLFALGCALAFLARPHTCVGAAFTLAWDPNQEPDLAGYKLYYGTSSGSYQQSLNVGNLTQYSLGGLQDGVTYFFAVTAYDTEGNESGYSNEVSARVNLPPQASASSSVNSGRAPLAVDFQGSGTDQDGTIVSYSWDFGDGAASSLQNPSHTFTSAGNFTARLTVSDNDGATATASVQITVAAPNQPPSANLTAIPTSGHAPLTVSFVGSGNDPDGAITEYSWIFGDGLGSTQQSPSHTYTTAGTYTATLTVRDEAGATASGSVQITVLPPNQPPSLMAEASPLRGAPPLRVSFSASAADPDGDIVSILWDFGDGMTAAEPNVQHTYNTEGTFTAVVQVRDDDGASQSKSFTIRVNAAPSAPKGLKLSRR